ncbi:uncharacterized protein GIQ15_01165 [Arthroderma uncinatum]|uniref:uncharacterized protein n=1 Tax=Arthroderma uncinatum TaxID=74035 RepID=UPI00144AEDFA|nr:uncharacterized protein GIQ15_01165 [Arthroderma uncinatum]KAF3491648.1 hypothetical protein GIQ15_01165 [Arthroderma uncinatum]
MIGNAWPLRTSAAASIEIQAEHTYSLDPFTWIPSHVSTLSKAASDRATTALIRRVLCPNASGHGGLDRGSPRPLEELLPPLTSSNEVDLQLYALMAVVIREFVYSWYSKITPDTVFTEEVIQLIAHCTRALEQRLRRVDVETLLFDEIPSLLEAHIIAYRTARESSAMAADPGRRLRLVYHMLNPHPALSPVPGPGDEDAVKQQEAERVYRQLLAHGAMAVLLPTEDLQNVCLRTLVGDILADLLLGGVVGGKVAEGWFIWDAISNILTSLNHTRQSDGVEHDQSGNLEKADHEPDQERSSSVIAQLLDISSRMPWLGGFLALVQHLLMTGPGRAGTADGVIDRNHSILLRADLWDGPSSLPQASNLLHSSGFSVAVRRLAWPFTHPITAYAEIGTLASSGPNAGSQNHGHTNDALQETQTSLNPTPPRPGMLDAPSPGSQQPSAAELKSIKRTCAANILALIPRRIALAIFVIQTDRRFGSELSTTIGDKPDPLVRSSTPVSSVNSRIDTPLPGAGSEPGLARDSNSSRGDGRHHEPATPRQYVQTRSSHDCNSRDNKATDDGPDLAKASSGKAPKPYGQEGDAALLSAVEHDLLDLFSDTYCNKHLIYSIVEATLVKLIPEMGEHSVTELMSERGVSWSTATTNE